MSNYKYLIIVFIIIVACSGDESSNPIRNTSQEIPNKLFEMTAEEIKNGSSFTNVMLYFKYDVSVHKIIYNINHKGKNITASGAVAIPKDIETPSILIDNHGTLQRDSWAPSNAVKGNFIHRFTQFSSAGYIVLAPDYIGFGESANEFHPWLLPEPGAEAVVGIINSAKDLLDQYNVNYENKIFITGFSEGANIVLGAQRRIEQNPGLNINLIASSPASGAYDMDYTFTNRILGDTPTEALGGAYIIITFHQIYDWSNPLSDFFKEPYASEFEKILNLPGAFEDNFFSENVISIDFANGVLNHDTLYNQSFLNEFESNPNNKVKLKLVESNIYNWTPVTPTMLHYGKDDSTTYYQNSLNTYQKFLSNGADPQKISIIGYDGKDHEGSESPWFKSTLDWFSGF